MKKVLLVMAIFTISVFAKDYGEATVFGTGNLNGKSLGFGIGAEYSKNVKKIEKVDLAVGFGLKYDSYDNNDDTEFATKVGTMPLYLDVKGTYDKYFVKGSLGYTVPVGGSESKLKELKGGLYLGFGIGMNKDNYVFALNYDISNYEGKYSDSLVEYIDNAQYEKMSLILGYKFK